MSQELVNRIKKRYTYLKKWAKRESVSCFRVYSRDLPDYPLILDHYDDDWVLWIYQRKRDETEAQQQSFQDEVKDSVLEALDINENQLFIKSRGVQKGTEQYTKRLGAPTIKTVLEADLKFEVNLSDYLDTGLFLDHRQTRARIQSLSKGKRVLNLFAYTGSFSVYAIKGGAITTTTIDLNPNYINWAKRNVVANFPNERSADRYLVDNCLSFLKNSGSKDRYDLIICDPPTFSNSKKIKNKSFVVNDDYAELIRDAAALLSKGGMLLFSTNSRSFVLDPKLLPKDLEIKETTKESLPFDFASSKIHQSWELTATD